MTTPSPCTCSQTAIKPMLRLSTRGDLVCSRCGQVVKAGRPVEETAR